MQDTIAYERAVSGRWLIQVSWCVGGMLVAVGVGALIGWFESWFEFGYFTILILYLGLLTSICWTMVKIFIEQVRTRFPWLALLVALVIILGFLGGYEIPGYFRFRQALNENIHHKLVQLMIDPATVDIEQAVDYAIYLDTGMTGYPGFLKLRAAVTPLDFIVRIMVGVVVAVVAWRSHTIQRYCKACRDFYQGARLAGSMTVEEFALFKTLAAVSNYSAAGQYLHEKVEGYSKVLVYIQSCPNPQAHDSYLVADRFYTVESEGVLKVMTENLLQVTLSGLQWQNLNRQRMRCAQNE